MNDQIRKRILDTITCIGMYKTRVEIVRCEELAAFDRMPVRIQQRSSASKMLDAINYLAKAMYELELAESSLRSALAAA